MLKKKLVKAGFFGHGALFIIIAPYNVSTSNAQIVFYQKPFADTSITIKDSQNKSVTDTGMLQAADSLFALAKNTKAEPQIQYNSAAFKYVKVFIKKNAEDLVAVEKRSEPYFTIIENIFRKNGLPIELKYLAVVESQLKATATSCVGAKGPWQFMPTTARDLGLKITKKYDERTNYYKSTAAAAKYLKSLYAEFGDWLLVIAAYNSGSAHIYKAIKKSGSRNFWRLQNFLPAETRAHVKRFIGTHYYFQQEGSLTILTRAEAADYLQRMKEYKIKEEIKLPEETAPTAYTQK